MKGKLWKIGVLLFAILMLLSACTGSAPSTPEEGNDTDIPQDERLAQLEAALERLKKVLG